MATVNLLPPQLRVGRGAGRSLFYPMFFLILFSAFAGYYLHLDARIQEQAEQKLELQSAIAALQPVRVQRETLMRLESQLQAVVNEFERRTTWSVYSDELAATMPDGVIILDLRLDGQRISFTATAGSLTQVAQMISNLTASQMYQEPSVGNITVGIGRVDFQATADIVRHKGVVPR